MNNFDLFVDNSRIPKAGQGVFSRGEIPKKKVVIYPNEVNITMDKETLDSHPVESLQQQSAIRWFDETYTVDPNWSLECYLNHSFEPNCLWYLGFVIALRDIEPGEEITIDYRHLLDTDYKLEFNDSVTGREIVGYSWDKKMLEGASQIKELFS